MPDESNDTNPRFIGGVFLTLFVGFGTLFCLGTGLHQHYTILKHELQHRLFVNEGTLVEGVVVEILPFIKNRRPNMLVVRFPTLDDRQFEHRAYIDDFRAHDVGDPMKFWHIDGEFMWQGDTVRDRQRRLVRMMLTIGSVFGVLFVGSLIWCIYEWRVRGAGTWLGYTPGGND